ncbi:methyltransferase [Aquipluma nitroreducens]|uniref:Methyltransferase n=1 Tax=Aquipluma nitroreducens TaxID=2010828 RepID=A0A5K7SG88_9BACT|nr:class I SAM-dependent methyltransferase [Aquipluma nitroreducens]BBE20496.1 methyltransferase [Aquipluma nitroreducens]
MFYTSIAPHYQHIFPFNPAQIEFLKHVLPYNGARVLDVGCATGDLAFALTHFGFPTWAFDFDVQMVQIAKQTKTEEAMFPVFEQMDMRQIDERFPESYFDTVICFGNTLVHLLNDDDIRKFIRSAFKVLLPEGKLAIQILNYQYIFENQIKSLPLIDNEYVRFERNYEFESDSELIDFNTKLTIKSTGQEIINSAKLYAIRQSKLQNILEEAGFSAIQFFGNFNREPLTACSLPLVLTCQKEK